MGTVIAGMETTYDCPVDHDLSGSGPMIVAKTRGLGSLISLEEDGESYDVSAAGRGILRRFMGQTYSVVDRTSGTQALVKYKVLMDRLEIG